MAEMAMMGMGVGGGHHLLQWGPVWVSSQKSFEILDTNFFFLAHFQPKKLTPLKVQNTTIPVPGCITCSQHRLTLKNGTTGIQPGLRQHAGQRGQKMVHPGKNVMGGNPTTSCCAC